MGGVGSGRREYGRKQTTGDCLSIDVNWLRAKGCLHAGRAGDLHWTSRGEPRNDIQWRAEQNRLVLKFRVRVRGLDWEALEQPLPIEWTACRFGGSRPWFRCPGIVNGRHCGRRVLKVYAGGKYFLCRHCYGLAYRCQSESKLDGLLRRADKSRNALGARYCFDEPPPSKPKGMHWRTYRRRVAAIERADEQIARVFQNCSGYRLI